MEQKTKAKEKIVYPVFEMEQEGKLIIPAEVLSQITFLHSHCGDTEWSGMLMYDVKNGDVSKPKTLELEAKHIFLMDIGSGGYTEYETDADIVDVYDHFEEAMEWKTGQIHTHHSMGTNFSGIDIDELQDNVDKHNYYLSVIVNFKGNFTAKVAFLSEMKITSKMNYISDKGEKKMFAQNSNRTHLVIIDMKIYFGGITVFFSGRLATIKKRKEEKNKKQRETRAIQGNYSHNDDFRINRREAAIIDPSTITPFQIDKLAIAILSFSIQVHPEVTMYSIISQLSRADEADMEIYFDYVLSNIDNIIEEFFGRSLTVNEYKGVIAEVVDNIEKYEAVEGFQPITFNIIESLNAAFTGYETEMSEGQQELEFEAEDLKEKVR